MSITHLYPATVEVAIVPVECGNCGITFGLGEAFRDARLDDGQSFYCPNGHHISWEGANEKKRLKRQLENAKAYSRHLADQRDAAERSARAYKGVATRTKRRVANGVCPCCTRTFQNVAAHMAAKHPDYVADANGGGT